MPCHAVRGLRRAPRKEGAEEGGMVWGVASLGLLLGRGRGTEGEERVSGESETLSLFFILGRLSGLDLGLLGP